jgi:hypothetical protein
MPATSSPLLYRRTWLLSAASALVLAACGGGDPGGWDEFRPRAATASDLAWHAFEFTGFSYGAVFDPTLSATTTFLAFEGAQADGGASRLIFSLTAGPRAQGTARLEAGRLALHFGQVEPGLPFAPGQVLDLAVEADVDDGRIRLTNERTGVQQASAPID